jgi:hypothetical protein
MGDGGNDWIKQACCGIAIFYIKHQDKDIIKPNHSIVEAKSTAIKVNYCPGHEAPFRLQTPPSAQWRIKRGRKTHLMQLRGANDHYKTGCRCSPRQAFLRMQMDPLCIHCVFIYAFGSAHQAAQSKCSGIKMRRA